MSERVVSVVAGALLAAVYVLAALVADIAESIVGDDTDV